MTKNERKDLLSKHKEKKRWDIKTVHERTHNIQGEILKKYGEVLKLKLKQIINSDDDDT